jgi:hypothetical protein
MNCSTALEAVGVQGLSALWASVKVLFTPDMPVALPAAENRTDVHEAERLLPTARLSTVLVVGLTGHSLTTGIVAEDLPYNLSGRVLEHVEHGMQVTLMR